MLSSTKIAPPKMFSNKKLVPIVASLHIFIKFNAQEEPRALKG